VRQRVYLGRAGDPPAGASYTRPTVDVSPSVVLAVWAAGVAAALGVVAGWRIVGPGFGWLGSGVTVLLGVPAALSSGTIWGWLGCALAAIGFVAARRRAPVVVSMGGAAVCFVVVASIDGGVLDALSGALLLGGVTGSMMLGHWYLVDPRLPRRSLRALAAAGAAGALVDFGVVAFAGAIPWAGTDAVAGVGFVLLAVTTMVLMIAVWLALGEAGYSGVMAATGLSYLAVLTAIGSAVVGRILAG